MKTKPLGELDELVLLAIGIVGEDAYANSIKQCINEQTARGLTLVTTHAALHRLEQRGFVQSRMGGATEKRGGRRKRLFTITHAGFAALERTRNARERMWQLMQGKRPLEGLA